VVKISNIFYVRTNYLRLNQKSFGEISCEEISLGEISFEQLSDVLQTNDRQISLGHCQTNDGQMIDNIIRTLLDK
jgi:hypothetical protein